MTFEELKQQVINDHPNPILAKHLSSDQYKLSLDILGKRVKLGLTPKQIAEKLGISEEDYLSYENCTNGSSKEAYLSILKSIQHISN